MFKKSKKLALLTLASLAFTTTTVHATVMDFTGMTSFTSYSQNGLSMTASTVWNWPGANMAHMDSGVASFALVSGLDFDLNGVEMISAGGSGPARFGAYNDGVLLGTVDLAGSAGTVSFGTLFDGIDEFRVSVPGSHFTFDNLNFAASTRVPEPGTVSLLSLGLIGMFAASRRKRFSAS